ncbi:pyridoxal-phosphate dependent enzyme [Actinocrispum sp. NPDC049592]|uniref:threonine ammonia-lyase n=1 Tax=Actinocrispum sp. NPDC049592 TaxID=3154835 RepID=UPI003425F7B3
MTTAETQLGAADVHAAAERIAGRVHRTPLLALDSQVLLKAEHLQHSGSFKIRGAANAMLGLNAAEVVTGSSGNHGMAVAAMGAGVTVVMAASASAAKERVIRSLGARVVHVDGGVAERERRVREIASRTGAAVVPSSDHELVVAGAGTVGLEVFEDAPDATTVFVPTGGGGLLAGVCLAAPASARVVGVEPMCARRYAVSLEAGMPVQLPPSSTIADGLRGQRPGEVPWPIIRRRVDDLIGVTDDAITHALEVLRRAGVAAEPSGAVALAGALAGGFRGRAVVIVSGGNTPEALAAVMRQHKERERV